MFLVGSDTQPSGLRVFLNTLTPGPVTDREHLIPLLKAVWEGLDGAREARMAAYKLDRIEEAHWKPPFLEIAIERHGAIVGGGSTRAEVQTWRIDLDTKRATISDTRKRQVAPMAPRLNIKPLAQDVAGKIVAGVETDCLKWLDGRARVRVLIGKVIPADGFAQTIRGRRRRFTTELQKLLQDHDWEADPNGGLHTYRKR